MTGATIGRFGRWAGAGLLALATPLAAQTAPSNQQAASERAEAGDAAGEGDEIIVTAQKRAQRLQDVPISISVQQGRTLEEQSINSFMNLQSRVPNLSVTDTPANASLFIRGIGTSGNSLSFEQSVALFVDGVYGGRNRQFMQPFFDVERVEVLRGPQGALFGRNTSAGAISVISRRPSQTADATAFGEYDVVTGSWNLNMAGGGAINDQLSFRVAARLADNIGFIRNTTLNRQEPLRQDALARASLLYTPIDGFSIYAKIEHGTSEIAGQPFEFVPGGGRPRYIVDADDSLLPIGDRSDATTGVVQIDAELGSHTLTAITGYSQFFYDNSFNIQSRRPPRLLVENSESFNQWSQEVRVASPTGGKFDYIFGGYLETSDSNIFRRSVFARAPAFTSINNETQRFFNQSTQVWALFAQGGWQPVEQIRIDAGLRWTRIVKEGDIRGFARIFNLPPGPPQVDVPGINLNARFAENDWSPNVVVTWRPSENFNVFARFAEGNKGGAFSEFQTVTAATFLLRPELSTTYEAGARLSFPDVSGYLNVTAFTTDYRDLQKSSLDIQSASFITSNAAGARTRGVEVDLSFKPFEALRISASGAYLDAFYTFYPNGVCRFPGNLNPGCIQDRSGDRLQNAPEWTGNVNFDLDQPVGDALRLLGTWTTYYQSRINFQDVLAPLESQGPFAKTDVRLGIAGRDRNWELAVLVRNLFDVRTSGLIFAVFPPGTNPLLDRGHMPDPQRQVFLQGRVRF